MFVLGIETTCDETAAAIVKDGKIILSNVIFSQTDIHKEYGGVFPELAARSHQKVLYKVIDQALQEAKITKEEIDVIAVANGPGLMGSILLGLQGAKTLAWSLQKPLIGVNHIEAHLYAAMMEQKAIYPSMGFVLSGGHTIMTYMPKAHHYEEVGSTVDDAIGESFDKVGSLLGLDYPSGPKVELLAKSGNAHLYPFKPGRVKKNPFSFSFSGLKTSVLYAINGQNIKEKTLIDEQKKRDIAASFQRAAFDSVKEKIKKALEVYSVKAIYFGGGVTQNQYLRDVMHENFSLPLFFPQKNLCLDNGAMIAGLGYHIYQRKKRGDRLNLRGYPKIPLGRNSPFRYNLLKKGSSHG